MAPLRAEVTPEIARAVSDPRRVEQVLLNLLANAIKLTGRGEVTLHVERAICPRLADLLGGEIHVESEWGQGRMALS